MQQFKENNKVKVSNLILEHVTIFLASSIVTCEVQIAIHGRKHAPYNVILELIWDFRKKVSAICWTKKFTFRGKLP